MTTVWGTLDRFLAGELPLEELVDWVAGTPALADLLAPEELRCLHLIDPTARNGYRDATASVAAIYETHRPSRPRPRSRRGGSRAAWWRGDRLRLPVRERSHGSGEQGAEWIPEAFTGLPTPSTTSRSLRRPARWEVAFAPTVLRRDTPPPRRRRLRATRVALRAYLWVKDGSVNSKDTLQWRSID
jgi:hypothetical protein